MTDETVNTIDTVPEADFAEQSTPAYPGDDELEPEQPATDREAAEADVIEQSIPVPLDEDYGETAEFVAIADYADTPDI